MEISLDKLANNEALIKINLKQQDYQPAVDEKIRDYSKKANIKGFRPGKVPQGLIKKLYGKSLVVDEVNQVLSKELTDYLRNNELQFIGEPLPKKESLDAIDWDNPSNFEFEYEIGYASDFEIKLDKLKTERYHIKIDDEVINETIENLQRQFGEPEVANQAEAKDFIHAQIISPDGKIDKELKIDLREVDKNAAKKLLGSEIDDQLSLDLRKLYSNRTLLRRQLGMTEDEFKKVKTKGTVFIKGIQRIKEAPVDENLFNKTFGAGNVKDSTDFRQKVRDVVERNYKQEEQQFFRYKLRETLIDKSRITLPKAFLKKWLKESNEEMTDELLEQEFDGYARELQWSLIRKKLVKDHDIKVDQEEVVNEAKTLIRQQFQSSGVTDGIEDHLDAFATNYLNAENGDNYMKVYNQVQQNKLMELLENEVTIKDKELTLAAFRELD